MTDDSSVRFACGHAAGDGRAGILACGEMQLGSRATLAGALKEFGIAGARNGSVLLAPGEYQLHQIEAPEVPDAEIKAAAKWKIKDVIGFPIEDASFDLLKVPGPGSAATPWHSMLAVVARRGLLKQRISQFRDARFDLSVIDVPETAQRNIATLYESDGMGVAWLYIDDTGGLMTISAGGELYLARRIDVRCSDIETAQGELREELFSRIVLDLQRTIDNFERQFSFVTLTKLVVGPEPEDSGLVSHLSANLAVAVQAAELEEVIGFAGGAPDRREQWRMFHLIGCALRAEAAAL